MQSNQSLPLLENTMSEKQARKAKHDERKAQ